MKKSKDEADYVPAYNYRGRQHCKECSMYRPKAEENGTCTLVEGFIAAWAHCKFWEKKKGK